MGCLVGWRGKRGKQEAESAAGQPKTRISHSFISGRFDCRRFLSHFCVPDFRMLLLLLPFVFPNHSPMDPSIHPDKTKPKPNPVMPMPISGDGLVFGAHFPLPFPCFFSHRSNGSQSQWTAYNVCISCPPFHCPSSSHHHFSRCKYGIFPISIIQW